MFRDIIYPQKKSTLIKNAIEEVKNMMEKVESMFNASFDYLFFGKEYSKDLFKEDIDINTGERIVRRLVFEHLTYNPKQDLIPSLILISIIGDVERIGDYTKHIWGLRNFSGDHEFKTNMEKLVQIKDSIIPQFSLAKDAFYNSDEQKGSIVLNLIYSNKK